MNKPIIKIKQTNLHTVLRFKNGVGFAIVDNTIIEEMGIVASLKEQADSAKAINCHRHAKFCNELALALS